VRQNVNAQTMHQQAAKMQICKTKKKRKQCKSKRQNVKQQQAAKI